MSPSSLRSPLRRASRRSGAALVEFAIVIPIFFLLLFGIVEFGRAMMVSNMVVNASREAARMAILTGSTNSEVEQSAKSFLSQSLNVAASDVTATISVTPAAGNPNPGNSLSSATSRDLVTVVVQVPFRKVSLLPPTFLKTATLKGTSAMRHE